MRYLIAVVFRNFGVSFKIGVKLGVSHNGRKSACRTTIRISMAGCARSVLVPPLLTKLNTPTVYFEFKTFFLIFSTQLT